MGGNAEAPSSSFPLPDPAPLFQRAVFSLRPSLPPPSCSSLRGQGSPPPPIAGRGAAGLTPLPLGLFPLPLPRRPRACTGWTLRWGRGPRRPLPACPVGIRPGAGTREGGEGGRAPLFKLVSFPRRRPRLGLLCAGVCPDRPTHPTSQLGGWGRLLKGSEWGSGARGLGPRRGAGVGQGCAVP